MGQRQRTQTYFFWVSRREMFFNIIKVIIILYGQRPLYDFPSSFIAIMLQSKMKLYSRT